MRRKTILLGTLLLAAGLPSMSRAQTTPADAPAPAPPAEDAATDKMRDHFEKGQDYYEQKKYDAAASEFRAAYDIKPAAGLLFNEAVCYEKLQDFSKAATLFKRYIEVVPNAKDRKAVEQRIAALEGEVARLANPATPPPAATPALATLPEVQVPGVFIIESKPQGATIYLDSKNQAPLGVTPWNGTIEGPHKVIVVAKGYKEETREVSGLPNTVNTLYMALSQQHYLGWMEVRANIPAADVYIDGKEAGAAGRTPYMGNITPGKHTIIVSKEGFTEEVKELEIIAGEPHKIDAVLDKAPIGFIQIAGATVEGARVRLDGKVVCESAPCRFQAPSGDRKITVEKKGLKPYTRKMTIGKATETALSVKLAPSQARTDLIWKFGFAAAFIGGGIALGLQANSTKDELQRDIDAGNPPVSPNDDRFLRGKIFAIAADGLFVLGGITAIYATISLFMEKGPPSTGFVSDTRSLSENPLIPMPTKRASIVPAIGPGYAGIAAEVRW